MKLYHGSRLEVQQPKITFSREDIDFGAGFYLTEDEDMAKKWACNKKHSVVNVYDVDIAYLSKYYFNLDLEWLKYIGANRDLLENDLITKFSNYDLLIGPTADDKLFNTVQNYKDGLITASQAIKYLNIAGYSNQYVFKNQESIDKLQFVRSYEIVGPEKLAIRKTIMEERETANKLLLQLQKEDVLKESEIKLD